MTVASMRIHVPLGPIGFVSVSLTCLRTATSIPH